MVSLPFLAGAVIAPGSPFTLRTAAAALAVLAVFLFRDPLVVLRRLHAEPSRVGTADQSLTAKRSLVLCLAGLALSGTFLLMTLPPFWVLVLGSFGLGLVIGSVGIALERVQRQIIAQMVSAVGLTASCLPAYLAAHGGLDWIAAAIWTMSAAHSLASILVVRARLETILLQRRSVEGPPTRHFLRGAVVWHAGLWTALAAAAWWGYSWLAIPFLFPGALHLWELRQFRHRNALKLSLHRVGWLQLSLRCFFTSFQSYCFATTSVLSIS
jgi:hypothetical protein